MEDGAAYTSDIYIYEFLLLLCLMLLFLFFSLFGFEFSNFIQCSISRERENNAYFICASVKS